MSNIAKFILSFFSFAVSSFITLYKKLPQEAKKRIMSAIILGSIFLFIVIKGQIYYLTAILVIGILMVQELITILISIKTENINFYETYRKWGIGFIIVTCVSLILIRDYPQGLKVTIWLFFSIWSLDAAAYFFGKKFGSLKLAPVISPNKTYEGSFCGTAAGMIVSFILYKLFATGDKNSFGIENFMIITFINLILAQVGDLLESWLKRQCKVKDSGSIIPGHGGCLDRFDSIYIPSIFIYIVMFLNNGIMF
jgi:phosphatidate cytidylyltransferase